MFIAWVDIVDKEGAVDVMHGSPIESRVSRTLCLDGCTCLEKTRRYYSGVVWACYQAVEGYGDKVLHTKLSVAGIISVDSPAGTRQKLYQGGCQRAVAY